MKSKSAASPQTDYQLKHRLAGAVIMVILAVLIIPWLLSEPASETGVDASGKNTFRFGIESQIITGQAPPPQGTDKAPGEKSRPALVKIEEGTPSTPPQSTTQAALPGGGDNHGQREKPPVPATSSAGWAVRVGTFSNQKNTDSVSASLESRGFSANKTRVKTNLGDDATLIWLGPYAKKETAGEVSLRIEALTGEKGFVIKHAP